MVYEASQWEKFIHLITYLFNICSERHIVFIIVYYY